MGISWVGLLVAALVLYVLGAVLDVVFLFTLATIVAVLGVAVLVYVLVTKNRTKV